MSDRTQYFNPPRIVLPGELKLRDVVRMKTNGSPFAASVVYKIADGRVHFYRPYAITGETQYSGGNVIPYIGVEDYAVEVTSHVEYELFERGPRPE